MSKHFVACQEFARKNIEQTFMVLQSRFAIVRGPARYWDQVTLSDIKKLCIIMHNLIIEDERYIEKPDFTYNVIKESEPESITRSFN